MNREIANRKTMMNTRWKILVCLFIIIAVLAVYSQLRNHEFINLDDPIYMENHYVKKGLSLDGARWAFSFQFKESTYWHPLTWLSFMLDYLVYGSDAGMHHFSSLVIHVLNSLLLFYLFNRMTGELWKCAFIAGIFAIHPLNVESVAWATQRPNILSTMFWMLTMIAYINYIKHTDLLRYLLTLFVFVLGLMAKPSIVTLPFVLLLLDYWPLKRIEYPSNLKIKIVDGKNTDKSILTYLRQQVSYAKYMIQSNIRLVLEKIPFFILSGISVFITISGKGWVVSSEIIPMKLRIANALVSYISYLGKMIWPFNLTVYYPYPKYIPVWQSVGAAFILVCLTSLILFAIHSKPYLTTGWLWFLGTLFPVVGLVQMGLHPAMADRYAYVSFIGLFIILAWGVPELLQRWRNNQKGLTILLIALTPVLMMITWNQVRYWKDSITLYKHTLEVNNKNHVIHSNLGIALFEKGHVNDAIRHYSEALLIKPDYALAHNNLGYALSIQGNIDRAIHHYHMAIRYKPGYAHAHNNLGNALAGQGKKAEAMKHYALALKLKPDFAEAYNNLGVLLYSIGKIDDAIVHFKKALRIKPDYADARNNLTAILKKHKKRQ
ncbi:MAG: tetratricopeptide repeat protein [Deltaproteobacteria bacterium]|nr:tetratricopeptide repeat protein [Deltaproteobacteria bacterium]